MARSTEEMLLDAFEFHADHGLDLANADAAAPAQVPDAQRGASVRWHRSLAVPVAAFVGVAAVVTTVVIMVPRGDDAPAGPSGGATATAPATAVQPHTSAPAATTPPASSVALPGQVSVPDLTGLTSGQAKAALSRAGLDMRATTSASDDYRKGRVMVQSPAAGERIDVGAVVTVTVGGGVPLTTPSGIGSGMFVMPSITQLDVEEATQRLVAAGWHGDARALSSGIKVVETSQPSQVGLILTQDPPAGERVSTIDTITVEVGALRRIYLPNLVGMTVAQAQGTLESLGWKGDIQLAEHDLIPPSVADAGTIAAQNPAAQSRITVFDNVAVSIYRG